MEALKVEIEEVEEEGGMQERSMACCKYASRCLQYNCRCNDDDNDDDDGVGQVENTNVVLSIGQIQEYE